MRNPRKNLIHRSEWTVITPNNALAFAAFDLWISNQLTELEFEHASLALDLRENRQMANQCVKASACQHFEAEN